MVTEQNIAGMEIIANLMRFQDYAIIGCLFQSGRRKLRKERLRELTWSRGNTSARGERTRGER
jgi:hypothetical protein